MAHAQINTDQGSFASLWSSPSNRSLGHVPAAGESAQIGNGSIVACIGDDGNDFVLIYDNCPPDLNNDGFLDSADIALFVTRFLAGDLAADFNNDTFLDSADIATFVALFLTGC